MKKIYNSIIVIIVCVLFLLLYIYKPNTYTVTKVIDGDTIVLSNQITVRFIGIDAPESNTIRYGYTECFGDEAKIYLTQILS